MKDLTHKDFFFCYNMKFSKELEQQGFRYICSAKNHNSNSIFHLYYLSNELKQFLDAKTRSLTYDRNLPHFTPKIGTYDRKMGQNTPRL